MSLGCKPIKLSKKEIQSKEIYSIYREKLLHLERNNEEEKETSTE